MSFGSVSILSSGPARSIAGGSAVPNEPELRVGSITEIGRFPRTPYEAEVSARGVARAPQSVSAHERAAALLQAEVARRVAAAKRKEVVIFIHGYNNTFADAVRATGHICDALQDEFVCVVLTWPAGGSGGVFLGYNIDQESGDFAVADMKKAIRLIGETRGVDQVHIIAHSRGTYVLATAIQQLGIEAYVSQSSISKRFKIDNIVLFAPDIDLDVASTKMFGILSDPDLLYGSKARPSGLLPPLGSIHLTVYSSPNDRALGLSTFLFGSVARLGQLSAEQALNPRKAGEIWNTPAFASRADFIEFTGRADFIGHSYFLANPTVDADLVALIRDRLKAGDPGRPLIEIKRPFWQLAETLLASQ
jgi:esterase/lipase superfamily enzyme